MSCGRKMAQSRLPASTPIKGVSRKVSNLYCFTARGHDGVQHKSMLIVRAIGVFHISITLKSGKHAIARVPSHFAMP